MMKAQQMKFDVWINFNTIFVSIGDIIVLVRNKEYPQCPRVTVGLKINVSGSVTAQKFRILVGGGLRNSEPTEKFVF